MEELTNRHIVDECAAIPKEIVERWYSQIHPTLLSVYKKECIVTSIPISGVDQVFISQFNKEN
jgi:hypothetical protein